MAVPCFFQSRNWGAPDKIGRCETSRTSWFFVGNTAEPWDCCRVVGAKPLYGIQALLDKIVSEKHQEEDEIKTHFLCHGKSLCCKGWGGEQGCAGSAVWEGVWCRAVLRCGWVPEVRLLPTLRSRDTLFS